jgi:hypothetical protein
MTPLAFVLGVVLQAGPASAQSAIQLYGQHTAYVNNQVGQAGADGQGSSDNPQAGSNAPAGPTFSIELMNGANVTDGGSGPTLGVSVAGGVGGKGNATKGGNDGPTGGAGGQGGTPQSLTLIMDEGSQVNSTSTSAAAVSAQSFGGKGGYGGGYGTDHGDPGAPGAGGNAGDVTASVYGSIVSQHGWTSTTPGTTALLVSSTGGDGAGFDGAYTGSDQVNKSTGNATGKPGGNAGNGGDVVFTSHNASFLSNGSGIVLLSQGGQGSDGVQAYASGGSATGGKGGNGGNGGKVTAALTGEAPNRGGWQISSVGSPTSASGQVIDLPNGQTVQTSFLSAALSAQSLGGSGGEGGIANGTPATAGAGGAAGSADTVRLTLGDTNVSTKGYTAPAILAQSIGGSGGNGADAGSVFHAKAGNGAPGGNGGSVTVQTYSSVASGDEQTTITTSGDDSSGIVAQSIGGGGGAGGSAATNGVIAGLAIGGDGEKGGVGGTVTVVNGANANGGTMPGAVILTTGDRSNGITAMSVGGGGGSGGNASSTAGGVFTMTVGGTGGSGGNAGTRGVQQVATTNNGIIQTAGAHAIGMQAMAVGGGGGNGGSAASIEGGAQLNITLAVGGAGGTAGVAGDVTSTNSGQILTQGTDAFGMQVLSVGGGGGNGGASKAAAYQLINSGDAPSLDFNLAIGGAGGGGGNAGNATGINNFSIVTSGTGSHGLEVQSIGGGGGNGGDSSSSQLSAKGSTLNINMALGGDGKGGGTGGAVTATNNGLIWTMASDSDAIFAQSVGGGGGNGGVGSADTSQFADNDSKKTAGLVLTIGGGGGTGNSANTVTVNNAQGATIITMGDNSSGIFAQSVGGSGGNGGGGISNGSSGTLDVRVAVGGNGGKGADGGDVTVHNAGSIVTGGGSAPGIYAESVGGGGGKGGKAATGGGDDPQTQLFNYLQQSLPSVVTTYSKGTDGFVPTAAQLFDKGVNSVVDLVKGYYKENNGNGAKPPAEGDGGGDLDVSLTVGSGFAGRGGSAGNGNTVSVANDASGAIHTLGPMSDGIFAMSVGGGGGDGGAVTASDNTDTSPTKLNVTIAVGGRGGAAGDGGAVGVTNSGSVVTEGSGSLGIFAGSFGGGGGTGGATATSVLNGQNSIQTVNVELGGDAGATGNGQAVDVYSMPGTGQTTSTLVSTSGTFAAGIGAMSVGGGGGLVMLNGTTTNPQTGAAVSTGGLQMSGFQIAGKTAVQACGGATVATCGNGGDVLVMAQNVQTSGQDAPGIVAQSIGGGGGWIMAAALNGQDYFTGVNGLAGNGQNASVHVLGNIATSGIGSYGIIAQSIGGGGLLGGDLASTGSAVGSFTPQNPGLFTKGSIGSGGAVLVDVPANTSVTASGANAIGIFAQSVGGGGGLVASGNTAYLGTAGGSGTAGPITVNVDGAIATTGANAPAIFVNADGDGASSSPVAVNVTGKVSTTGLGSSVIQFDSNATSNTVNNSGLIDRGGLAGYAVTTLRGDVSINNASTGTINGAVRLGNGTFTNHGTWMPTPGSINYASEINSDGNIVVGSGLTAGGSVMNTLVDGYLVLGGTLTTYVDFVNQQLSEVETNNGASLVGTVKIMPVSMANATVEVLSAPQGLGNGEYKVVDGSNYLYKYTSKISDNALWVTPVAQFSSAAAGLGRNAQQLANHLQANFNAGATSLSPIYDVLAQVKNPAQYGEVLNGLGAESLQMVGTARISASESFVNRMDACPNNGDTAADQREHDCAWGRVVDQATHADGSAGDTYGLNEHIMQVGAQHELADSWWIGGSVAYNSGSESASSGVGGVSDHGFTAGVVIKRELGQWTFTGALDAALGSYQSSRNLQLVDQRIQANGSFDASNVGLHSRVSYLFADSTWYVRPYVDLHVVNVHTDSFEERSAGALGLKVDAGNGTVFSATPMVEAGDCFVLGDVEIRPSIGVGRAFYSGNHWDTDMRLNGAADGVASFNSEFSAPRQLNQYSTALNLKLNAHSEFRLDYTGQFGKGYRMNEGALRYTYFF